MRRGSTAEKLCHKCLCVTIKNSQGECVPCKKRRRIAARLPKIEKAMSPASHWWTELTAAFRNLKVQPTT